MGFLRMKQETIMRHGLGLVGVLLLVETTLPSSALAAVKREGTWPSEEKKISLEVTGASRAEAVRRIASAAGWNVVVHAPPGDPVDIHVKDLPATKVLDLVLNDANYVAHRDGTLIEIARETPAGADMGPGFPYLNMPPVPSVPPMPPVPPVPPPFMPHSDKNADKNSAGKDDSKENADEDMPRQGSAHKRKHEGRPDDRIISGGSLRIEKGEVVDDVSVFGGSVDVYGEVLGDLSVMGGSATVHDDAYVHGDVSAIGGRVRITDGARVGGEVGVVGGAVDRAPGAKIGEPENDPGGDGNNDKSDQAPGVWKGHAANWEASRPWYKRFAEHTSNAVQHTALLFVLGAVLLSLATRRMDLLRTEIASRPMRSFAVGILAALATSVALVALCVTLIGIPIAIIGVLVGAFAIYAGICAVLATLGKALVAHKTDNQHVHLAMGCLIFLVLSAIPVVGWIVMGVIGLIGLGALVATRLAGFAAKMPGASNALPTDGPYRTPT